MRKTGFSVMIVLSFFCFVSSCSTGNAYKEDPSVPLTKLEASPLFRNFMVLQRESAIPVWGTGHRGKTVQVRFNGQIKTVAVNAEGSWMLYLDPVAARTEPQEFVIEYLSEPDIDLGRDVPAGKTFHDVLIGDVWLCSGQSNMEYGMGGILNKIDESNDVEYPDIRLYMIYKQAQGVPRKETNATWFPATGSAVFSGGWHGFSAIAFTFARELYRETGVPQGLIQAAFGGSKIEAWIPPEDLAASPVLSRQYAVWKRAEDYYHEQLEKDPKVQHPFNIIGDNYSKLRPATAYYGMIAAIVPYSLKGIIWYQGESDIGSFETYAEWTEIMVKAWRREFKNDLPFYFCQLAPYGGYSPDLLPKFWAAQEDSLSIPGSGMALTIDVGNAEDIHPKNKAPVGRRLALLALAGAYGKTDLNPDGPVFENLDIEGNKAIIHFKNADNGLATSDENSAVYGFTIAGADGLFHAAEAIIDGNTVIVSDEDVAEPLFVRYAWSNVPKVNLINKAGLPARPFRTDRD